MTLLKNIPKSLLMRIYDLFLMLLVQFCAFISYAPQFSFLACELSGFLHTKIFDWFLQLASDIHEL